MNKSRWEAVKEYWKRIPEQFQRLIILVVILVAAFLAVRSFLIPSDFGQYGHYRASALEEIISQDIQFAGQEVCYDCHEDVFEMKGDGSHQNVSCEVCHGPAFKHTETMETEELQVPNGRSYCPLCHEYLPSRPTGFPQIISESHNPMKPCISCHDPHDPEPPDAPKECSACHAEIARTKSLSHHVYVPCTRCHEASEEHKLNPRRALPSKPASREFCGSCHAKGAPSEKGIPRIDMESHYIRYVCWQCHYPHLPEAR